MRKIGWATLGRERELAVRGGTRRNEHGRWQRWEDLEIKAILFPWRAPENLEHHPQNQSLGKTNSYWRLPQGPPVPSSLPQPGECRDNVALIISFSSCLGKAWLFPPNKSFLGGADISLGTGDSLWVSSNWSPQQERCSLRAGLLGPATSYLRPGTCQ